MTSGNCCIGNLGNRWQARHRTKIRPLQRRPSLVPLFVGLVPRQDTENAACRGQQLLLSPPVPRSTCPQCCLYKTPKNHVQDSSVSDQPPHPKSTQKELDRGRTPSSTHVTVPRSVKVSSNGLRPNTGKLAEKDIGGCCDYLLHSTDVVLLMDAIRKRIADAPRS